MATPLMQRSDRPRLAAVRARVRRSGLATPLVVIRQAIRGDFPLGAEGDSPHAQRVAKAVTAAFYNALSRWLDHRSDAEFLNYGYLPLDQPQEAAHGDASRAGDHLCENLYRKVAGATDLRDKDVLEVGSGRGGGAAFVARDLHPRTMVGVDLSARNVAHCQAAHQEPNLRFVEGDAEDLPFAAGSFDALVNVESSHAYPSMRRFLNEAHRVLRPEGMMLFADQRGADQFAALREQFRSAGFVILEEERITPGVVRALELDNSRRAGIVAPLPGPLRRVVGSVIGVEAGKHCRKLRSGDGEYFRFALRRET